MTRLEPLLIAAIVLVACASPSMRTAGEAEAVRRPRTTTVSAVEGYLEAPDALLAPEDRTPRSILAAASKHDKAALAEAAQNPVANLISLPFQNNTGFGYGDDDINNSLLIQPVYPFALSEDWNLITRTILPVIYQPEVVPGEGSETGLGDTSITGFFSPKSKGKFTWGVGPVLLVPTATSDRFGAGEWGLGGSVIGLVIDKPWVVGLLANNVSSFEGNTNTFLAQPILNYNLDDGWYIVSTPTITANWEAESSDVWTVPVGGGIGKITHFGKQPVNLQVQVFYNLDHPDVGPEWTLRIQIQFLFPK